MFNTVTTVIGVLIILYGLILLTRKNLMVNREYDGLFVYFISTLNIAIKYIKYFEEGYYVLTFLFIIVLPVCVLIVMISRGRYTLTNVNAKMVSDALTDILKEKGISYEEEKNAMILKDYDDKRIFYNQFLNSVEINLKDIRYFFFYKELKEELRCRIKKNKTLVFPATGLSYIVLGLIYMVISQYLGKRLL